MNRWMTNPARRAHSPFICCACSDACRRAGMHLQAEMQSFVAPAMARDSAALLFIAVWGGIVLLAIVLPPHLRVPVLAAVALAFVIRRCGHTRCESRGILARRRLDDLVPRQPETRHGSAVAQSRAVPCTTGADAARHTGRNPVRSDHKMISPLERARLLDAEMRSQRAWLELRCAKCRPPLAVRRGHSCSR